MQPQRIESMALENGLTLEIWDASRQLASDRWLVKLVARMEIEVSHRWFGDELRPPADLDQMRAKLGTTLCFEYQTERNFVDQREKQIIYDNMFQSLLAKKPYYSHPDFAARFMIKEYASLKYYPDQA